MAYDKHIADRVRRYLGTQNGVTESRMIGSGLSFMVRGKLCCGIGREAVMIRVGPAAYEQALAQPHARPMIFGGKSPRGYLFIDPPGIDADQDLHRWIDQALACVQALQE